MNKMMNKMMYHKQNITSYESFWHCLVNILKHFTIIIVSIKVVLIYRGEMQKGSSVLYSTDLRTSSPTSLHYIYIFVPSHTRSNQASPMVDLLTLIYIEYNPI